MDSNLNAQTTQLSADFKAFQQEMREMRREYDEKWLAIQRESDEKWLAVQLETRDRIAESDAKLNAKIAASNDKFNSEMSSLSRDNTRFSRTIIIGAAVVSVISPVIKEIAPFVTELLKTALTK